MRPPPIFWVFNSPSPHPTGAYGHHRGKGHVGRHCPYTNNIWCGSVQALLRYRSKTAKMQKFPIDSHSNENFISPFFRPPGAANYQKGRRHIRNQSTLACKIWRELARGLSRNRWQKTNKTAKVKEIPRPSLYERMAGKKDETKTITIYIAPWRLKTQRRSEDRELNHARSKPHTIDWPVSTARTFVHHYNSIQHCST